MALRFALLASGSSGNAALLEAEGSGLLIDAGLGPRQLASRLLAVGASWHKVHAVLLTHTHGDHWKERTLAHLVQRKIPLFCHPNHHDFLLAHSLSFAALKNLKLVHFYKSDLDLDLSPGLRCRPLPLSHDGGATFGFRFEVSGGLLEHSRSIGYLADLGSWTGELALALANVDLLALEFNHDVDLECASGRAPETIARILGEEGHLSNDQAAALLGEILRLSTPGRLRHLVLLHLSRDCNRPELAHRAAKAVLARWGTPVETHLARQNQAGPILSLDFPSFSKGVFRQKSSHKAAKRGSSGLVKQNWLPGIEDSAER